MNWDRYNEYQKPLVDEIVARFEEGCELVVLSCPTGGGKTTVAEAVRQTLNLRGVYLCTSLQLMDQFHADFPYAKLVRGRRNYIPTDAPEEVTCDDCDFDPDTDVCTWCSDVSECPYRVAKHQARIARLACTNTSYYLGEMQSRRSSFADRPFVVIDEADRLEEELLKHVSISIPRGIQRSLDLAAPTKKTVQSAWREWFDTYLPLVKKRSVEIPEKTVQQQRLRRSLERLAENMKYISDNLDNYVFTGYDQERIEFRPITATDIGPAMLWNRGNTKRKTPKRWLAMSATLGSPEAFVSNLGFKGPWASVFAPPAFDPERRPVYFYPAARMSKKDEATSWPKMAEHVRLIIERHPGERVLIHTHAYTWSRFLYNQLEDMDRSIFAYFNARERAGAIEDFEGTVGGVLLAPSLERGYNGRDDLVRVVILTKVPHPYLGDKQVSARLHLPGGQLWYSAQAADAITQAFGRGMRHAGDHMTGYILDAQFGEFYAKWKRGDSHMLFAPDFREALHMGNSEVKFELRQEMKRREMEKKKSTVSS